MAGTFFLAGRDKMAWEKLSQRRDSVVTLVGLSLVWIALVITGSRLINFDEPYLPFAIAGALAFFLRGAPSRWEVYAWLSISVVFVKVVHLSQVPFWVLRVASSLAVLGLGALVLLGLRALWSEQEGRDNALALLVPSLVLIFFMLVSGYVLKFSGGFNPQTDDAWLYAFDVSLGFQPSFLVGRLMYSSLILARSAMLTYLSLPFAMAVVCAWRIPRGAKRISWHMLAVLLIAGVSGWLLYNVVPGTGPIYVFGKEFPWGGIPYKELSTFALQKMTISTAIPRNAMPSLHVAWVVLLLWNSKGLGRALRAALAVYLLLTVVATLGSGQHYFVDLVVSLPFALAVQATASYTLPNRSRRFTALIAGLAFTVTWLFLVRFGVFWALKSPAIPWSFIVITTFTTIWLHGTMLESASRHRTAENVSDWQGRLQPSARLGRRRKRPEGASSWLSKGQGAGY
jgi:hypothetical protein